MAKLKKHQNLARWPAPLEAVHLRSSQLI